SPGRQPAPRARAARRPGAGRARGAGFGSALRDMSKKTDFDHLGDNPFYVLGLPADCARVDVEREGQKLLGMLGLGLKSAATYMTPVGPRPRTEDKVRAAMAAL